MNDWRAWDGTWLLWMPFPRRIFSVFRVEGEERPDPRGVARLTWEGRHYRGRYRLLRGRYIVQWLLEVRTRRSRVGAPGIAGGGA